MRRLHPPNLNFSDVFLACVSGAFNEVESRPYKATHEDLCRNATLYKQHAVTHTLFKFQASEWGNDNQISFAQLTKGGLNYLYKKGLIGSQQGRPYYDQILAIAPLGKCPYCQFGHVETLDHFLPKARYPSLAVVPDNLVPACKSCNSGKGSSIVSERNELSHPYFEDERIESEKWLHAEVSQTNPVTLKFFVKCPTSWPIDLERRVSNYFYDFNLAKRYSVEAASELVSISAYISELVSPTLRMEHLHRVARQEEKLSKNGWKTALYQALAHSNWYGELGFSGTGLSQVACPAAITPSENR